MASLPSTVWAATSTLALPLRVDRGVAPATTPMHIAVAMKADKAGIDAYLRHEYTKGDPLYHRFLTPAEFTARFSASPAATLAVENYLTSLGMRNVKATPNRMLVTADTTAAVVQKAFSTSIHLTTDQNRPRFANVLPAKVPAVLAPAVLSVLGLDNFQNHIYAKQMPAADRKKYFGNKLPKMKTYAELKAARTHSGTSDVAPGCNDYFSIINGELGVAALPATPAQLESAPPFCYPAQYTPSQYRLAYDDFGNGTASKTIIADFTEGATNLPYGQGSLLDVVDDLKEMYYQNGLPQTPVVVRQVGTVGTDTSGEIEWDIDSQGAAGIAGGVKAYYFYNGTDLSNESESEMFSDFATDDIAQLGNASFGGCEDLNYLDGGLAATDELIAEIDAQGQTLTVASGDSASNDCLAVENGVPGPIPSVDYPGSSTYSFAVGGTSLLSSSTDGTYYSETTWCGLSCGGGGGPSHYEQMSPWQSLLVEAIGGQGLTAGPRLDPDMAMNGDPYSGLVLFTSGVEAAGWGGTSLAAPLAEGVLARLDTGLNNQLGNAGAALYQPYINAGGGLGAGIFGNGSGIPAAPTLPSSLTPPVIGGINDVFLGTNGAFDATPGFDLNTGMGSFNINALSVYWGV